MAQKRILKRDASTGRISEGASADTYFSADPSTSSDLTTKNYADTNLAGQGITPASSAGQIPIFNGTAWVPGDPYVQGVCADGTLIAGFNGGSPAIPLYPVYVGGQGTDGELHGIKMMSDGTVYVTGGGGGTQYADNSASGSTPTGTLMASWDVANSKIRAVPCDASQFPKINVAASALTDPAEAATNTAVPAKAIQIGGSDGTNLQALLVESSTHPNLRASLYNGATEIGTGGSGTGLSVTPTGTFTVSGTVSAELQDNSGNGITSNSTTTTSTRGIDMNIRSILNTAPTTAGKLDVKAADGDVFVRQATATNLKTQANAYDGAGNAVTSNSTATSGKVALDNNILSILGTAPTTAGKLDVKAADGDLHTDLTQVAGNSVATATTGVQLVGIEGRAGTSFETTAGVLDNNLKNVGNNAVVTAANGVQKVGITGSAAGVLDGVITAATAPANGLATLGVFNTTQPAPTNGQSVAMQIDQVANHLIFNGVALKTLSAQGTSGGSTQTIFSLSGAAAVMVQLTQTTTITAGAVTFEFTYDGTNFTAVPANCVVDPTSATFAQIAIPYTCQASTNKQFLILCNGATGLRIRTSTTITGTGSVTPNYALLNFDPLPSVVALSPTAANFNVTVGNTTLAVTESGVWSVRTQDGAGNAITSNSTTYSSKIAPDCNLLGTLGTAFSTAGKVDVKAADGDLHVDNTQINGNAIVTAANGVQKVGIVGNANATVDATVAAGTAPTNGVATLVQYNSTIPAATAAQTLIAQSDPTGSTYVNTEGRKKTYSTYATFTAAAGVIAYLPGNATTTVRVLRVEVSLSTSGTAAIETISLIKTSAAPTSGTAANMTIVPHDSSFAGASSVPQNYTVAPTPGTPVGTIRGVQFSDASSTLPGANTWLWDWGIRPGTAIVLRGTAQTLEVNLGAAVSTQTATVSFEWTEE